MNLRPPGYELCARMESRRFRCFPAWLYRGTILSQAVRSADAASVFPVLGQIPGQVELRTGFQLIKEFKASKRGRKLLKSIVLKLARMYLENKSFP